MRPGVANIQTGTILRKPFFFFGLLDDPEAELAADELELLATSDVYWDRITSVEPDGIEDVYDLTVEDLHNFVAGNVILHNSIEQDADVVMFLFRPEYYKSDEKPGIAEMISSQLLASRRILICEATGRNELNA